MKYVKLSARQLLVFLLLCNLLACSSLPEKDAITTAAESPDAQTFFEGSFIAPGVDFSRYKKIIITDLDLNQMVVKTPASRREATPWTLKEEDKRFIRQEYTQAAVKNLVVDGAYATTLNPAEDALLIETKVLQIAPLQQSEKDKKDNKLAAYNETSGVMTITIELYDSATEKLLGTITDSRDLGFIWDEKSQSSTGVQIRLAFDDWLKYLRTELDQWSRRQTPLDKLLIQ